MYLKFKIRPAIPDWLNIFFPGVPLPTPKSSRKTKKDTEKRGLVGGYEKKIKKRHVDVSLELVCIKNILWNM